MSRDAARHGRAPQVAARQTARVFRFRSLMPFSGDIILGQRHHQVFVLEEDGARHLGPVVRLPSTRDTFGFDHPSVCWTAGETHVVYSRSAIFATSGTESIVLKGV